ncbi:MAG TPA: CBS domain-containing protein [Vicinamibacterales bacterium]|nr:CBS domain-containing protein [Vicinamibacterales bacterium]
MQIKDIMSHPVVTCSTAAMADEAARLMWENDCGIVPIVDADGHLSGVITDRDLCMAAYTQGMALAAIPVTSAMAGHVAAAHVDDSVESVESLMRASQIRRVPILDRNDRLAGIVAMNDLARLAVRSHRNGVDRELVKTMAAVCQPRAHAGVAQPALVERPSVAV